MSGRGLPDISPTIFECRAPVSPRHIGRGLDCFCARIDSAFESVVDIGNVDVKKAGLQGAQSAPIAYHDYRISNPQLGGLVNLYVSLGPENQLYKRYQSRHVSHDKSWHDRGPAGRLIVGHYSCPTSRGPCLKPSGEKRLTLPLIFGDAAL